jgi:hypothetical protein
MSNILLIFICLIAGNLLVRSGILPKEGFKILNNIIIYICLPALAILYIPQIKLSVEMSFPISVMWIVFLSSVLFFIILQKIFKWDKKTTGALIMTAGLCNSAFIGFPVLLAMFGEEGLKIGIIIDQAGSFFVLATGGVITCSIASKGKFSIGKIIKNIIVYPPFAGFIIGLIINITGIQIHHVINDILVKLGSVMIILALLSVGMQLNSSGLNIHIKNLFIGLSYKLIIAPLIIFILFYFVFQGRGLAVDVSLIESAMPPMVMGAVMAVSYDLNPELANMMVGIGIPVSFFTIILWYYITLLF